METITSRSNPRIKQVRLLRQRKERQASGLFLIEGIRHVGAAAEAAAAGAAAAPSIESIFFSPELLNSEFAHRLVGDLSARGVPCYPVAAPVFETIADKENPQGLLAMARAPRLELKDLGPQSCPWLVAAVTPQDPGNLGTLLRTIDAVGADGLLLLDGGVDPYHPGAVRASMGALFWHPVVSASFAGFAGWAGQNGYSVYGTSAHGAVDYRTVRSYRRPLVLLLGSEREGLSAGQRAACTQLLKLPMSGRVTSLNLSVAAGVMLYAMLDKFEGEGN